MSGCNLILLLSEWAPAPQLLAQLPAGDFLDSDLARACGHFCSTAVSVGAERCGCPLRHGAAARLPVQLLAQQRAVTRAGRFGGVWTVCWAVRAFQQNPLGKGLLDVALKPLRAAVCFHSPLPISCWEAEAQGFFSTLIFVDWKFAFCLAVMVLITWQLTELCHGSGEQGLRERHGAGNAIPAQQCSSPLVPQVLSSSELPRTVSSSRTENKVPTNASTRMLLRGGCPHARQLGPRAEDSGHVQVALLGAGRFCHGSTCPVLCLPGARILPLPWC